MLPDCVDVLKERVEETKAKETSKSEPKCHSLESEVDPTRSSTQQKGMAENSHSKQGNRTKKCEEEVKSLLKIPDKQIATRI